MAGIVLTVGLSEGYRDTELTVDGMLYDTISDEEIEGG